MGLSFSRLHQNYSQDLFFIPNIFTTNYHLSTIYAQTQTLYYLCPAILTKGNARIPIIERCLEL